MPEQDESQDAQREPSAEDDVSAEEDEPTAEEASADAEAAPEEAPDGESDADGEEAVAEGEPVAEGEQAAEDEQAVEDEQEGDARTAAEENIAAIAAQAATPEETLEAGAEERNLRKERVGRVVSDKMDKTIVVSIERRRKHPMYKKYLNRSARKMAHDEGDDAGEGDTVRIMETRPISKHKRWRLVEILERAE